MYANEKTVFPPSYDSSAAVTGQFLQKHLIAVHKIQGAELDPDLRGGDG